MLKTPPNTTPSTPAQVTKNFSPTPPFVQSSSQIVSPFGSMNVSAPSHLPADTSDFGNISAIIARQNSTSPEIHQSPVFSGPMTPAASPGNMTALTNFFSNSENSSYAEMQPVIFQSPTPNPLCFYDSASYPFEQLQINQLTYM
ncbi:9097_t:CDS:1 [Acaulospora morrowiae]|uniref:9097_t:CDS:1 n=1 Tax=Acaulospora morrowiae TaxID=94023 RepID=A0A9N8Z9P9_9GLOM|nr:9097_t:CDS:1 [Acaulospora morrowiae]